MREAFNKTILKYKDKPIIQLIKDIGLYLINRIIDNRKMVKSYFRVLCPKIKTISKKIS